jgi:hypothetical protein
MQNSQVSQQPIERVRELSVCPGSRGAGRFGCRGDAYNGLPAALLCLGCYQVHAADSVSPLRPWSLTALIQADSPRSECDTRGPGFEHLNVQVLDGIGLLINGELYVPQEAATNRAVIWALFGRSGHVRVSVYYDMPIRQGVPHRFDVEFKIDESTPEITLQRFSLTEEFDHSYRLPDHALGEVAEIAATDLKGRVLKRGTVHKASITATFHKSGTQHVYFNAMMYDRRQDWDTRCGYEMRVRPRNEEGQNHALNPRGNGG